MLTLIDEYARECLAIDVARRLTSEDVLERPSDLFVRRGVPDYIRSDNGPEFAAKAVRLWLARGRGQRLKTTQERALWLRPQAGLRGSHSDMRTRFC